MCHRFPESISTLGYEKYSGRIQTNNNMWHDCQAALPSPSRCGACQRTLWHQSDLASALCNAEQFQPVGAACMGAACTWPPLRTDSPSSAPRPRPHCPHALHTLPTLLVVLTAVLLQRCMYLAIALKAQCEASLAGLLQPRLLAYCSFESCGAVPPAESHHTPQRHISTAPHQHSAPSAQRPISTAPHQHSAPSTQRPSASSVAPQAGLIT
jgi:hypothetical protein